MRTTSWLVLVLTMSVGWVQSQDPIAVLTDAAGVPGSVITTSLLLDNETAGGPIQGFSFSFYNPGGGLTPGDGSMSAGVSLGPALAAMNGGFGPDMLIVTICPDGLGGTGIGCGTVFSYYGFESLPPVAGGHHCLDMVWTISPTADPGLTTLEFCACLCDPPLSSIVVIGGASIVPLFVPATVEILEGVVFLRGDPNSSDAIDIADPIYALNYLFQSGPILCLDAMDANASGAVDLADVLYLLNFINGDGPPPPAPFPACGNDAPVLGCDSDGACG